MRIMHFLNHTPASNGHVHVAVDLACVQSKMGHSVSVVCVVLNGTIGSPRLSAETPRAKILNRPAITFVGGLHPRKGVDDLITAFKTVSEFGSFHGQARF
jgi:glycosyltransferase involved in cell wall biosynthesis